MCLTLLFTSFGYALDRAKKIEQRSWIVFTDPYVFISGGVAGFVGRAAALPFDKGGAKGPFQACYRRIPQWGLLMWIYVPLSSTINAETTNPAAKAFTTFFLGSLAGFITRLICNPVNRVRDEARRMNVSFIRAANILRSKTILQFYYTTPPLVANAIYCGALMTFFEGFRRFAERQGAPIDNMAANAAVNACAGGLAAATASTLTFPFSSHRYLGTVIHNSSLCRGLGPTLLKEIPMAATAFGVFSLIQPIVAPHHGVRCGFGY